jgi:polysaccharide export outer membrane protein
MRKFLAVISVTLALAISALAQSGESLLIGPGDLVRVQVFDTPEMDQHVRVMDSGIATLAFVGDVKVINMTPADAARNIEKALFEKGLMLHPAVTVSVEQYATQSVSLLGQVRAPGLFPVATPQSIFKVLSLAGGLTELADRNITIERHGDAAQRVKFFLSNTSEQALDNSVLVYPGDTVIVPKAGFVYILGDVARPGGYPIATNTSKITMLEALAMAGSANKTSTTSKVRLIRKTAQGNQQEMPVQVAQIEKGQQPDLALQADDVIYVPFSWMKNVAVSSASIVSQTGSAAIYLAR